jgi:hypothetical protein
MNESFLTSIVTVATALIGVAILAVIVSPKSQTANVVKAGGQAFSGVLGAALSPVAGSGFTIPTSFTIG